MKRLITLLALLTSLTNAFAQYNIGIKANGGVSNIIQDDWSTADTKKAPLTPSWHGGLFFNYNLDEESLISAELLVVQIESKTYLESPNYNMSGVPTGDISASDIWKHITYLSIPVYYGYKINKFNLNLGISASLLLQSSLREKAQTTFAGTVFDTDTTYNKMKIDKFDFGVNAQVVYNITDKIGVEGTYYYGVNNLLLPEIEGSWRNQQITLGIRYRFFTK